MHDIDRTTLEADETYEGFEAASFEDEGEDEVFSEDEVDELASEILGAASEDEVDYFLGKLLKKAGRAVGKALRSPVGKALGGLLKNVAKTVLPIAGQVVGTAFGGPAGGALAGQLGSAVSGALEMDMEGLSSEEQELQKARKFVKLAGTAAKKAARSAGIDPEQVARQAFAAAAKAHAPALMALFATLAKQAPALAKQAPALARALSESEEMELASELLESEDEDEVDQFLGRLVKKVARAAGALAKGPAGQMLKAQLKQAASAALPSLAQKVGSKLGGAQGAALAGQLADQAAAMFGLEAEGLSEEEAEYESARRFVRFATDAARKALARGGDPAAAVRSALIAAAREHAPGLLAGAGGQGQGEDEDEDEAGAPGPGMFAGARLPRGASGRWVRRGHTIVLYGA